MSISEIEPARAASASDPAARPILSALVVARTEERQLADCLPCLGFADEIVVVLDRCTDGSEHVARRFTDRVLMGAWPIEGDRRNGGIANLIDVHRIRCSLLPKLKFVELPPREF